MRNWRWRRKSWGIIRACESLYVYGTSVRRVKVSGSADADDGGREREEAMQHLLLFLFRRFASTFSQCCLGSNVWLRPAQILRGKRPPFPFSAFMWSASEPDFMSHDLTPFSPHCSESRYLLVYYWFTVCVGREGCFEPTSILMWALMSHRYSADSLIRLVCSRCPA